MADFLYTGQMDIPRIIHQSYKTVEHPYPVSWQESWRAQNPDWQYIFHTDADNHALVAQHFPEFLEAFDELPVGIMRADFCRFLYMYHWGGVYADLDYVCLRPFDDFMDRIEHIGIPTLPDNGYYAYHNALLVSEARNPFWLTCAEHAVEYFRGNPNPRVEELAGPLRISAEIDIQRLPFTSLLPEQVTPIDWYALTPNGRLRPSSIKLANRLIQKSPAQMHEELPEAFAITFWAHNWTESNQS